MIKCVVIDDEELARELIKTHIEKVDFLEFVADFDSPLKAMELLNSKAIDIVFLDIQMPDLKGTDFAKLLLGKAQVIFTTAYSEYALEGYELDVIDYLLKPITFQRFLKAVSKVKPSSDAVASGFITVKSGYDLHKIKLEDILYIKSDGEYVIFYLGNKKLMTYQSLKSLEASLPASLFMRVHRSYIINKTKVESLKDKHLLLQGEQIPISSSYLEKVKNGLFGV